VLKEDTNKNPLAAKLGLRGRIGNETRYGDADWYEEESDDSGEVYYQSNGDNAVVVYERPRETCMSCVRTKKRARKAIPRLVGAV
jgi:hypothetical protein